MIIFIKKGEYFQITHGADYPGNDITDFPGNLETCKKSCLDNNECTHFSVVRQILGDYRCYLKRNNSYGQVNKGDWYVSGKKYQNDYYY